jgi:hypothetical protein
MDEKPEPAGHQDNNVEVGSVADVSEVHAPYIFKVDPIQH